MTDGMDEPQWQPISRLAMLTGHAEQGVALAREHLALLGEARGAYRLSRGDVDGVVATWTTARTDLIELFTEQARRWQALDGLDPTRRTQVDHYARLVTEELASWSKSSLWPTNCRTGPSRP